MSQAPFRKLTIVIPALNEEGAIASTISRCLAAREEVKLATDLDVEIIVVSDGSTDRTAEIASEFGSVDLIVFEKNRGYGAAIKEGFARGTGELVGFLDADGTCDPNYFVEMCRAAIDERADVVLGSRMGPDSKMPPVRRMGNRVFALLLGALCGRHVTDTASGMRVIRRDVLDLLYPLPDRLHFTPAMSARALLNDLRVVEIPMKYEERVGASKLQVVSDGFRFFRAIVDGVLCFRPERPFFLLFTMFLLMGTLLGIAPTEYYLQHRRVEELMIYRFVVCFLLGAAGSLLLCAAVLANRMADLGPRRRGAESFWVSLASQLFRGKILATLVIASVGLSTALIWPGLVEFVTTGGITLHWSRIIVGAFGYLVAFQALTTKVLMETIAIWQYQGELATPRPAAKPAPAPPSPSRGIHVLQRGRRS